MARHFVLTVTSPANGQQDHHVTVGDDENIRDATAFLEAHTGRCSVGWGLGVPRAEPRLQERVWNKLTGVIDGDPE